MQKHQKVEKTECKRKSTTSTKVMSSCIINHTHDLATSTSPQLHQEALLFAASVVPSTSMFDNLVDTRERTYLKTSGHVPLSVPIGWPTELVWRCLHSKSAHHCCHGRKHHRRHHAHPAADGSRPTTSPQTMCSRNKIMSPR